MDAVGFFPLVGFLNTSAKLKIHAATHPHKWTMVLCQDPHDASHANATSPMTTTDHQTADDVDMGGADITDTQVLARGDGHLLPMKSPLTGPQILMIMPSKQ